MKMNNKKKMTIRKNLRKDRKVSSAKYRYNQVDTNFMILIRTLVTLQSSQKVPIFKFFT